MGSYVPQVTLPDSVRLDGVLDQLERDRVVERIWRRDHTLWSESPDEVVNRLAWLTAPVTGDAVLPEIESFAQRALASGFERVLLMGMGGSSLGPEHLASTFKAGGLPLRVLDSTVPADVQQALEWARPESTLFIVSSKSGSTAETLAFFSAAYNMAGMGQRFVAITDPGSPLADAVRHYDFATVFRADPSVGGRFSILTPFGLVPAVLCGVDVRRLLERARLAREACGPQIPLVENPGSVLGAFLGECARNGRDKVTLLDPGLPGFGEWAEQLLAESTGKVGVGIVPVVGEPIIEPREYRDDRAFVYLRLSPEASGARVPADDGSVPPAVGDFLAGVADLGHPVAVLELADRLDLGAQYFIWEFGTAVAGHILGVQPFDQPNVESAKRRAKAMMEAYARTGALPEPSPYGPLDGLDAYGPAAVAASSLAEALMRHLDGDTGYIAIQAFLPHAPELDAHLSQLRETLLRSTRLATTLGYGPRYLHSTGQLHKGGGAGGRFLMLTANDQVDVPIPDAPGAEHSTANFGTLKTAQAIGDFEALTDAKRRALRLHLGSHPIAALEKLIEAADALKIDAAPNRRTRGD